MTGEEFTDQIIKGLASSLEAKNNTRSNAQIMAAITAEAMDPKRPSKYSISESSVAMSCEILLPCYCMPVIQIINGITTIIDLQEGQRLSVAELQELFTQNRQRIAEAIQNIQVNDNLKFRTGNTYESMSNYLEKKIQIVLEEFNVIGRAYQTYLQERVE